MRRVSKAIVPNQTPFPTDEDLLKPNSTIGLMIWRASAPEDNDVWLSVKDNMVKLMLAHSGLLKAGMQFDLDPMPKTPIRFSDVSSVVLDGPLFKAFKALPDGATDRAEQLERFVWLARASANDGKLSLSMSAQAVDEAQHYASVERHAHQTVQAIDELAAALFKDPSVTVMPVKAAAPSKGRRP